MTVSLRSYAFGKTPACSNSACTSPSSACLDRFSKNLTIGLINNMPDGALEATERQFLTLLESASDDISIRLCLYSLPGVPRNKAGAAHINEFYTEVDHTWNTPLDGLIVTGREPLAPNLQDEPYWDSFTRVLDWARDHTFSTVWSCIAAHAAVLHMDDIRRVRSDRKHCGIYECEHAVNHPLIAGTPSRFRVPHSRWNGLAEEDLTDCGYDVLTRTAHAGVDTFVRRNNSLFVFFQGHPEYDANTLLFEYRRDVGRYLRGETVSYPSMPRGYFDRETAAALADFAREAQLFPREELIAEVSSVLERTNTNNSWNGTAVCIYRNWLHYISTQKRIRLQAEAAVASQLRNEDARTVAGGELCVPEILAASVQRPSTESTASLKTLTIL